MNGGQLKYITLIGSRSVPDNITQEQIQIGYKYAELGYIGRSGAACDRDWETLYNQF